MARLRSFVGSRRRHRQEVVDLGARAPAHRRHLAPGRGSVDSTSAAAPSDTSEQSERFSGPETNGFLSDGVAAEVEAEVALHVRVRVVHAVGVVLGGDGRQRIRLVAEALEVAAGDAAEDAGKTRRVAAFFLHVGALDQRRGDSGVRRPFMRSMPITSVRFMRPAPSRRARPRSQPSRWRRRSRSAPRACGGTRASPPQAARR
jgi:hypothetical protein